MPFRIPRGRHDMSPAKIALMKGFELCGNPSVYLLLISAWRLLILQHHRKGQTCKDLAFIPDDLR